MGKKKKCPEGHHGGSWKVAFADFMTAMFALFLLMWLVNLKPEQKQGIESYFRNYSIFKKSGTAMMTGSPNVVMLDNSSGKSKKNPESRFKYEEKNSVTRSALRQKMMEEMQKQLNLKIENAKDQVIIETFKEGIRVQMIDKEGKPMFALGSAEPTEIARKILKVIGEKVKESGGSLAIEGHTDAIQYSSSKYTNWELSTERASSARRELEAAGVNPDNLVSVSGYAATRPLIKDNIYDPRNRRISILINVKPDNFEDVQSDKLEPASQQKVEINSDTTEKAVENTHNTETKVSTH